MRISDWSSDVCSSDLPLRAEMMPSISGPSAISAASGEGEQYTAAEMSASDGSCCCAAKLADAVPVSLASSKRILGLLEMTIIAVLLQTRSVGMRDRKRVVEGQRVAVRVNPGGR